jgi:hypothetical protein
MSLEKAPRPGDMVRLPRGEGKPNRGAYLQLHFVREGPMRRITAVLLCAFALIACGPGIGGGADDDDDDDDGSDVDAGNNSGIDAEIPAAEQCRKMDLIFVVDDSGSMAEEQGNLATNFPMFAQTLNSYTISTGEQLDYRAGVTTSGVTAMVTIQPPQIPGFPPLPPIVQNQTGDDGRFRTTSGMPRPWLERNDPNMTQTFAQIANVGTSGPGLEMQLRAAELATTANAGFMRDDALLGIVVITDEDDCSRRTTSFTSAGDGCATNGDVVTPVIDFVNIFDTTKGDRGRWAAAIIAGQTNCTSSFGDADEGIRLKQFQQAAGTNAVFGDICAGNLQTALTQALDTFQAACDNFPPID